MGKCRTPYNRIVLMRKRGLNGPLFQNVGGACVKSVGNYLDVNGPGGGGITAYIADTGNARMRIRFGGGEITATSAVCGWTYTLNGGAPITPANAFNLTTELELVLDAIPLCSDVFTVSYNPAFGPCDLAVDGESVPLIDNLPVHNQVTSNLVITTQPQPTTVTEPNAAQFAVSVSGGTGSPSYQWHLNDGIIGGATVSILNIDPTSESMSGNEYWCAVSDACTTVNSNKAELTVNPAGAGAVRELLALAPNDDGVMSMIVEGVGPGSYTHASRNMVRQANGIYAYAEVDEPMFNHGRVVTNIVNNSARSDLTWAAVVCSPVDQGDGSVLITLDDDGAYYFESDLLLAADAPSGRKVIASFEFKGIGSSIGKSIAMRLNGAGGETDTFAVTDEWQRVADLELCNGGAAVRFQINLGFASGELTTGDQIYIRRQQFETDVDQVGENVPTTSDVPATACMAHENGHPVLVESTPTIVTEAKGAPYSTVPRLLRHQDATNVQTYSNDLTGADWTSAGTVALDQIGLTGEVNTASLSTDASAVANRYSYSARLDSVANENAVFVFWIKKTVSNTYCAKVGFFRVSDIGRSVYYFVNTNTGVLYHDPLSSGSANIISYSAESISDGDWWKVCIERTTDVVDSANRAIIYPASSTTTDPTTDDVTQQGSQIIGNICRFENTTIDAVKALPPIITGAAAETAFGGDADIPEANMGDIGSGAWYAEVMSSDLGATVGPQVAIVKHSGPNFVNGSVLTGFNSDANIAARGRDSSNGVIASSITGVALDVLHKVSAIGAAPSLSVNVDGVYGSELSNFDNFGDATSDILLMAGSGDTADVPREIGNVQRYGQGTYQQYKDQIDLLMAQVTYAGEPVTYEGEEVTYP